MFARKLSTKQLTMLVIAIVAVQRIGFMALPPGPVRALFTDLVEAGACLWALSASVAAATRSNNRLFRLFWLLFGCSFLMQLVADLGWAYCKYFQVTVPDTALFPSLFYRLYAVPIAIILFLPQEDVRTSRLETFLDACIVIGLVGLGMYQLQMIESQPHAPGIVRLVTLGTIVNAVVITGACGRFAFSTGGLHGLFGRLASYLAIYSCVAFATSYVDAYLPQIDDSFDLLWVVPYLTGAILASSWRPTGIEVTAGKGRLSRRLVLLSFNLTMGCMVLGCAVLGMRATDQARTVGLMAVGLVLFSYCVRCALMQDSQEKFVSALQESQLAAEAATRAKSQFLSNMSHEIRTPLNGVLGMLDLVGHTELAQEQRELVAIAGESAHTLLVLVNDILDFSKIEAGRLKLDETPIELTDLLTEATRTVLAQAHAKRLDISYEIGPNVPRRLSGDPVRLKQVISNLLSNAVKFTERGSVLLRADLESRSVGDEVVLKFCVMDTGIGIPSEKIKDLFQEFSQVDSSVTRRFGGTGLGLAICSRLVALMQGSIWVESEIDKGSRFTFTARLGQCPDSAGLNFTDENALRGVKALLVEGNERSFSLLRDILQSCGAEVRLSAPEETFLELSQSSGSGAAPRLLLCDHDPPKTDGFDLLERLVRAGVRLPHTLMVVTSADYHQTIQRCRALGVSHLIKPFKRAELVAALEGQADRAGSSPVRQHGPAAADPRSSLRILVAEDNAVNQKLVTRMLQKLGHQFSSVENGLEACEKVKTERFDVILMDGHMPEMDGLTATRAIREWERARGDGRIPIVALTAMALDEEKAECFAAGMDAYLPKPISLKALEETLEGAVRGRNLVSATLLQ